MKRGKRVGSCGGERVVKRRDEEGCYGDVEREETETREGERMEGFGGERLRRFEEVAGGGDEVVEA